MADESGLSVEALEDGLRSLCGPLLYNWSCATYLADEVRRAVSEKRTSWEYLGRSNPAISDPMVALEVARIGILHLLKGECTEVDAQRINEEVDILFGEGRKVEWKKLKTLNGTLYEKAWKHLGVTEVEFNNLITELVR